MRYAIKVAGDWTLDVLAIPFDSVDSDEQYFDAKTDLMADVFQLPAVVYYHGIEPDGRGLQGDPELIGKAISKEVKPDGVWVRVALNKAHKYAKRIWEAAQKGLAAASSGSIAHLARLDGGKPYDKNVAGRIAKWAFAELSLIDIGDGRRPANMHAVALPALKTMYKQAGIALPDKLDETQEPIGAGEAQADGGNVNNGDNLMDENKEVTDVKGQIDAAIKADREQRDAEAKAADAVKAMEAIKAENKELKEAAAKDRRLPTGVHVAKYANTWKYDNVDAGEHALMNGILKSAGQEVSEDSLKALAIKIAEGDNSDGKLNQPLAAMKMAGMPIKSNELNQSTLASYGDEWVGETYSSDLWNSIRLDAVIASKIPSITVPQGSESVIIPLESGNPTFYKVAQASAIATDPGTPPTRTVTSSKLGTGQKTLSVSKLGAMTAFTGELVEDSLIPWMSQLKAQMVIEGAEVLDHIIIDGDTETGATTNINDIGGTPAGTEAFMLFNGMRKSCLVTTTANSRDGGVLAVEDFLETLKLMGLAGKNAMQKDKVAFISDLWTMWKALELPEVKTRDVFVAPTVENGTLSSIYGYDYYASANMHRANQNATYGLKANSAGKVDLDTVANNSTGSLLAVRFDQWMLGFKRRMTIETNRVAAADSTEIVALMRVGLAQRDTQASAISYNLGI